MHLRQQLKKITLINFQRWYKSWLIKYFKKYTNEADCNTRLVSVDLNWSVITSQWRDWPLKLPCDEMVTGCLVTPE